MGAGAEGQAGLQVQHHPALGVAGLLPQGADEQLLPHGDGVEVLLPVVDPVLFDAAVQGDGVVDAQGVIPLLQVGYRLRRVLLGADVHVDHRVVPVLLQQLLVDEVDVGDLHGLLF